MLICPVETPVCNSIATCDVVAVIRELLAGAKPWSFANDLVTLDHELTAIRMSNHPLATEQSDRAI